LLAPWRSAAGLSDDLPCGGISPISWPVGSTISNQYEHVGSSWGGVMFGLENRDLMLERLQAWFAVRMVIREVNTARWVRFAIYNYKLYKLRISIFP
jgi:hypothetical protein